MYPTSETLWRMLGASQYFDCAPNLADVLGSLLRLPLDGYGVVEKLCSLEEAAEILIEYREDIALDNDNPDVNARTKLCVQEAIDLINWETERVREECEYSRCVFSGQNHTHSRGPALRRDRERDRERDQLSRARRVDAAIDSFGRIRL